MGFKVGGGSHDVDPPAAPKTDTSESFTQSLKNSSASDKLGAGSSVVGMGTSLYGAEQTHEKSSASGSAGGSSGSSSSSGSNSPVAQEKEQMNSWMQQAYKPTTGASDIE